MADVEALAEQLFQHLDEIYDHDDYQLPQDIWHLVFALQAAFSLLIDPVMLGLMLVHDPVFVLDVILAVFHCFFIAFDMVLSARFPSVIQLVLKLGLGFLWLWLGVGTGDNPF
jgi:hypothetical protein